MLQFPLLSPHPRAAKGKSGRAVQQPKLRLPPRDAGRGSCRGLSGAELTCESWEQSHSPAQLLPTRARCFEHQLLKAESE